MKRLKNPLLWFVLMLLAAAILTAFGPQEKSLGPNIRIIYLHGAWALTAEAAFGLAAVTGLIGLITRRETWQRGSVALGRTGIFFWATYLPLSLWAMQANWNGLFLSEPRFRVALTFAVTGILMQVGLSLLAKPALTSLFNVLYFAALLFGLSQADYVMHPPPSPIFNSGLAGLQVFFIAVILLTVMAAGFMSLWWLQKQR